MALEIIRRLKWHLASVAIVATLVFGATLAYAQGRDFTSAMFVLVYGAAFLATTAFFPLCYLAWFGQPKYDGADGVSRFVFWLFLVVFLLFFARVFIHALGR